MPKSPYRPQPIDTSRIQAPAGLSQLIGQLAGHVHDVWAAARMAEGWRYGPQRDDEKREHPDLVEFERLSLSEQRYDIATVEQTLRGALALGWSLDPPETAADGPRRFAPEEAISLRALQQLAAPPDPDEAQRYYSARAADALRQGEPLIAYDVAGEGLTRCPGDLRLRQLQALALGRSGAAERSADLLLALFREGREDGETLGLLAGRQKELALRAQGRERELNLDAARRTYELGYRQALHARNHADATYTGINLASLALLAGRDAEARQVAEEVLRLCDEPDASAGDPYWLEATRAEARLVLADFDGARAHYQRAAGLGAGRFADLASTRAQARRLQTALGVDTGVVDAILALPSVAVFSRAPRALDTSPSFALAAADETRLAAELDRRLAGMGVGFGYASPRGPEDVLFLEAVHRLGGEIQVVLPFTADAYRQIHLADAPPAWRERFDRLLEIANAVRVVSPASNVESAISFEYADLVLDGIAALRGRMLDTPVRPVLVWGGTPGGAAGSEARLVAHWRHQRREIEVIEAGGLDLAPEPGAAGDERDPGDDDQRIMAMLFADAPGFTRLEESQIPLFMGTFMGTIADLIDASPHSPVTKNTWGDGLYFVFEGVESSARFALDLRDRVAATDWGSHGLPESLSLRIALHAGPVFPCVDPVIHQPSFTGTHVSQTARIEPITPPGEVYASEGFAALAAAQSVDGIACEYVGLTPFAKGYGTLPLYHVRRA